MTLSLRPERGPDSLTEDVRQTSRRVVVLVGVMLLLISTGIGLSEWYRHVNITRHRPAVAANQALLRDLLTAQAGLRGFAAAGNTAFLEPPAPDEAGLRAELASVRAADPHADEALLARQERAVEAWLAYRSRVISTRLGGTGVSDLLLHTPFPEVRAANVALGAHLDEHVRTTQRATSIAILASGVATLVTAVGLLALGLRLRRRLESQVVVPLHDLRAAVARQERDPGAPVRVATDVGPVEVRDLSSVVAAHLAGARKAREDSTVERHIGAVKERAALDIRRSVGEGLVLDQLARHLGEGLDARVRLLRHDDPESLADPRGWDRLVDAATPADSRGAVVVDPAHPATARTQALTDLLGVPSLMATVVPTGQGPAAVVLVGADGDPDRARCWHEHEARLLADLAAYATRGIDQCRYDEERSRTISQLEALDRHKSAFLATVSHELRTPLTSIAGYLELLQDGDLGPLAPAQERALGVVERNTARLRALIEDLLVLSRIEDQGVELVVRPVRLHDLVADVVENLQPQAASGAVDLIWSQGCQDDVVHADRAQVERALTNVIGNAVKFTPPGGSVSVSMRCEGPTREVVVRDTGIGIPADELDQVGRRFFRATNATAGEVPGTGLGLAIVRSIAEAHGGSLALESAPGEGTTVTLTLPADAPARPAAD